MNRNSLTVCLIVAAAFPGCTALQAAAQAYPVKPVRIVVPFPPGSGADIIARTVGVKLTEKWRQQVLVDSRPGASGIIASEIVSRAAPDGYTLMVGTSSSHAINVSLYSRLPYDAVRDFAPVSLIARVPLMVAVHPSVPANSIRELIALARARPGQLNFGSAGTGTTTHLSGELFKTMAGVNIVHIPYRGSPQALTDAVSGQVSMVFAPTLTALPQVQSGRLKALAMTTSARSSSAPEVPTVAESGLPGYEATLWYGFFAPGGTPREIVEQLSKEVVAILGLSEVRDSLRQQGAEPAGNSPEEFAGHVKSEIAKWAKVVKISGARAD